MPDEFDFKNYKSLEEFGKTVEGTKYLHDLYLKAVNHPVRREILQLINKATKLSEGELFNRLKEKSIVIDKFALNYNIDYLLKAFCIEKIEEKGEIYYEITQSGKVIEYLK
ncbi:MAG: winged helix-turn-helix domain-containing protein [Candidatus Hodarchaeota archaeon]